MLTLIVGENINIILKFRNKSRRIAFSISIMKVTKM